MYYYYYYYIPWFVWYQQDVLLRTWYSSIFVFFAVSRKSGRTLLPE